MVCSKHKIRGYFNNSYSADVTYGLLADGFEAANAFV